MTPEAPSSRSTLVVTLFLLLAVAPAYAQIALEPVEPPRMDHYETAAQTQMAAAQGALDRALDDPGAEPAHLAELFGRAGELYLLYDFMAPAAAALRNAQALAPDDPRWAYYLAIHHRHEGELEKAVLALGRVVTLTPENLAALTHRADIRFELGLHDEAAADYRRLLESNSLYSSAAQLGLGRIAFERRDYEPAAGLFQAALVGQPKGSVVHHHLGLALRRLGRREEAAAQFALNEHLGVTFPDPLFSALRRLNVSREAHIKRGTSAMRQGHPRAALAAFLDALADLPDDPHTLYNVAVALIALGEKQPAEARLRESIAIDDNYRDPQYNLGLLLAERGDLGGAERHFRRASEIDPEDVEARVRHAAILTRLARPEEAVALLEDVVASDGSLALAQLALGAAHQTSGNREAARAALNRVLEAAPGAPQERSEAHYRLAALLDEEAAATGNPAASEAAANAVSHLRAALELDAGFAEAHVLLGRLLGQQERYAEAAGHFASALVQDPSESEWHRDRAMALLLARRYAAARSALTSARRALAPFADNPSVETEHLDTLLARLLAASPDGQVRNGREALAIAQRLMNDRPSIEHAETVAMALAEVGEFERAAEYQSQLIAEVERQGGVPTGGQRQRLESYLAGQPVREPWFSP